MNKKDKNKLPVKLKLKAWWDGYDPDDLEKKLSKKNKSDEPAPVEEPPAPPKKIIDAAGWGEDRINITQYIWGEGFCGPGGKDQIVSMTKLLALDKKMSLLEIGAGLGGKGRALAEAYGVWVTGLEPSQRLTEMGNEISTIKGMLKKVETKHVDWTEEQKFKHNYDRIFAKESLFTIQDKEKLLRSVYAATKPEGMGLFTDYVLGYEGAIMKAEFKEWREGEPVRPYCLTELEFKELIEKVGYKTRVNEDISAQYIELISNAWKGSTEVVKKLIKEDNGREMIDLLLAEAEIWTRRVKLLKSGELKVWRVLGYKSDSRSRMMSDW